MSKYVGLEKRQPEKLGYLPDVNTLLKISFGLIFFTMLSTTLVYAESFSTEVDVDGTLYDVDYVATGITISSIDSDSEVFSLFVTIEDSNSLGNFEIILERTFFDSLLENGDDDDFFVIVDGDFADYSEIETTSTTRTLSVEVPSGTEEIEIIGTSFENPVSEPVKEPTPEPVKEPTPEPVKEPTPEPVETPSDPTPVNNTPKTQCGPGTILKDGACVLDERCGPGTILKDGACVLDKSSEPKTTVSKGMGKELGYGVIAAFVVTGAIAIILGLMSKASKSKD